MVNYLKQWETKYHKKVCKSYNYAIEVFNKTAPFNVLEANYAAILQYIAMRRKLGDSTYQLLNAVSSLKFYYHCLLDLEIIKQHPCPHLVLKDRVDQRIFVDTLYTKEELETFVNRQDQGVFKLRNQVIRQLLVYQGVSVSEIVDLEVESIDLDKGSVRVNDRSLKLKPQQTLTIYKYLKELHPKLIKHDDEALLLLSRTGRKLDKEHINSMSNKGYSKKFKPRIIRQSVIYQLLQQGENLRSVQLFAGHRSILSTERYQKSNLEQLRGQLQLHHPLNDI